jgi:hypothetical protein
MRAFAHDPSVLECIPGYECRFGEGALDFALRYGDRPVRDLCLVRADSHALIAFAQSTAALRSGDGLVDIVQFRTVLRDMARSAGIVELPPAEAEVGNGSGFGFVEQVRWPSFTTVRGTATIRTPWLFLTNFAQTCRAWPISTGRSQC